MTFFRKKLVLVLFVLVGYFSFSTPLEMLSAQEVSPEELQKELEQIQKDGQIEESLKTQILGIYKQALEQLKVAEGFLQKKSQLEQEQSKLSTELQKLKTESTTSSIQIPEFKPETPVSELEKYLQEENLRWIGFWKTLLEAKQQKKVFERRKRELPPIIEELKTQIEALAKKLLESVDTEKSPIFALANRRLLVASKKALVSRLDLFEKELPFCELGIEQTSLQIQFFSKQIQDGEQNLQKLREHLYQQLRKEIQAQQIMLQERQKQIDENKSIEEALRKKVMEAYKKSLELLKSAESFLNQRIELDKKRQETPSLVEKLREALENMEVESSQKIPENASLSQIEQLFTEAKKNLTLAQNAYSELEAEQKKQSDRQKELEQLLETRPKKAEEWAKELQKTKPENETDFSWEAQQTWLKLQQFALQYELMSYEKELKNNKSREELLKLRQEQVKQQKERAEKKLEHVQKLFEEKKKSEATLNNTAQISEAEVQEALKQLEEKKLEESVKEEAKKRFTEALQYITEAKESSLKAENFDRARLEAPSELEKIRAEQSKPLELKEPELMSETPLNQVGTLLSNAKNELNLAKEVLKNLKNEEKNRQGRREKIPQDINKLKKTIEEVVKELSLPSDPSISQELALALRYQRLALKRSAESQIASMEKELLSYDARTELLPLRIKQAERNGIQLEKLVANLEKSLNDRKQREAEEESRRAKKALQQMVNEAPSVVEVAQKNAELAQKRTLLTKNITLVTKKTEQIQKDLESFLDTKKWVQEVAQVATERNTIGTLLRSQREKLIDIRRTRKENRLRQAEISEVQIQLIELKRERNSLSDIDARKQKLIQTIDPKLDEEKKVAISASISELLQTQTEYLDTLINEYNNYSAKLFGLDASEKKLINETEEYATFLNENILWIPSGSMLKFSDFKYLSTAWDWFTEPEEWKKIKTVLLNDFKESPLTAALALLLIVGLAVSRNRLAVRLDDVGKEITALAQKKEGGGTLRPTFFAFLLTVLIALVFPSLVWLIAWRLATLFDEADLGRALGIGLATVSFYYFIFEFVRQFCRKDGLGEAHFQWSSSSLKIIRSELVWYMWVSLPSFFFISMLEWQPNDDLRQSCGRFAFIIGIIALAVFTKRVLNPSSELMEPILKKNKTKWFVRLQPFWYPVLVGIPLVLAVITFFGYYYTSVQLERRFHATLGLLLCLLILNAIIVRWFSIARLTLALDQLRTQKTKKKTPKEPDLLGETPPPVTEKRIDISAITLQTQKLTHTLLSFFFLLGLWGIWVDVIPALGIVSKIEIVSDVFASTQLVPDQNGMMRSIPVFKPLTLKHVLLSILVFILTIIASRNIRGILEFTVLQKLPLDSGGRYAFTTLAQYLVTAIGLIFTCSLVGITWSKLEWIVAFMGLGLSFGLQEIFANFFSGIILLFERPIRVGDVITIGDSSGSVSRIQIRATTIIDWDRKELIIPNKQFITEKVTNWTLSNKILRVVIPIGVAYGSNTKLVEEKLLQVAKANPDVSAEPAPSVVFMDFGDNSLIFHLRVFISDCDKSMSTRHALNNAIDEEFRKESIEISFPQRDLHLRTISQPFEVKIIQNSPPKKA